MTAITERTGKAVFGQLVGRIESLVASFPVDALLAGVRNHPNINAGPPALVADLESAAAAGTLTSPRTRTWVADPECPVCEGTGSALHGRGAPPGPCACRHSPEPPGVGESTP